MIRAPTGATLSIRLELDQPQHWLGENILVHYVVENHGALPAQIGFGGDYRGATRAMRYRVQVTAADGSKVRDPDPSGMNMGGLGGEHQLEPGARFTNSLPLMRYAALERAGPYRVRVAHDLGWGKGQEDVIADDDPRWAEVTINVAMPSATQANQACQLCWARYGSAPAGAKFRFQQRR